jgi:hypothetical protein
MATKTERIRALNDQLRTNSIGGRVMMTRGIATLPADAVAATLAAVRSFDCFTPDNDPHGEHDFALIEDAGERVMFKIDYYDRSMTGLSPDPSDPAVTNRVLTILLASEY